MKRYAFDELTRKEDADGDYCEYDEVNEIIMNMVDEFAETAKGYEAEIAKKDEEIETLKDICAEKEMELFKKDKLYNELYVITNEEMDKLATKIVFLEDKVAKDRKNYEDALTDMIKEKNEEIARLIESYNKAVDPLEDDVKRQKEEIARLRKALEKVAAKWHDNFDACVDIAREALERKST